MPQVFFFINSYICKIRNDFKLFSNAIFFIVILFDNQFLETQLFNLAMTFCQVYNDINTKIKQNFD